MRLSIILAVQEGAHRLEAVLGALAADLPDGVEVLLAWPRDDGAASRVANAHAAMGWLVPMQGGSGALVPELWALGIRAARSPRVALTVVHCVPPPGWVQRLLDADLTTWAGLGGPIDQRPGSDSLGWAIYLQRYTPFASAASPHGVEQVDDIAADNALYDRAALNDVADSWAEGFWEPTVHAALRARGRQLACDPALVLLHDNGYSALGFIRQRLHHGFRFGRDRARAMPPVLGAAYAAATPTVPLLFGRKVLTRALRLREARPHLPGALPWLAVFVGAWALGEVLGAQAGAFGGDR